MRGRLPLGPLDAAYREPMLVTVEVEGGKVAAAEISMGLAARGFGPAFEGVSVDEGTTLASALCADSSVAHALAFCQAIEEAAGVEVAEGAWAVRVVLAEYERVASHLGVVSDLGKALEDDILLHGPLTYRNALRRVFDGATGSPLARGAVEPGGSVLRKGVDPLKEFAPLHGKLKRDAGFWEARARMSKKRLDRAVLLLDSIEGRPPAPAYRASGLESDLRAGVDAYGLYSSLAYRPAGRQGGTALDRALVLSKEIRLSLDLVEDVVSSFPVEPSTVEITSFAKGNGVGICESPEGAIEHVVYLGSGGHVMRNRINCETERLAAFAAESLAGVAYQDLAPAVVSFNLCAACGDR